MSESVDVKKLAIGAFSPSRQVLRAEDRAVEKLDRGAEKFRKDPSRRRRFLAHVQSDTTIIRSALATLVALMDHSDDSAKPVWPSQARLAKIVGVDKRTIRRHLAELRDAGYLKVFVYGANRNPNTGCYTRRQTNRYYFTFCQKPGNGRRVRRNPSSHLEDTGSLTNPLDMSNHRPSGGVVGNSGLVIEGKSENKKRTAPSVPTSSPIIVLGDDFEPEGSLAEGGWATPGECMAATRALLTKRK